MVNEWGPGNGNEPRTEQESVGMCTLLRSAPALLVLGAALTGCNPAGDTSLKPSEEKVNWEGPTVTLLVEGMS